MQTATSVSNLRTITGTSNEIAHLLGSVTIGDGGGGVFFYATASTSTDNDGTVVKPTAVSDSGRWIRIFDGAMNIKWFASKVASGNWSPAFQAALNTGGQIYVPNGNYRIDTSLTNLSDVNLFGQSFGATLETSNDIDILDFTSNSTNGQQFDINTLSFSAKLTQASGSAIKLTWNSGNRRLGKISNIRIGRDTVSHSFKAGIRVMNPQELVIEDVVMEGSSTTIGVDFNSDRSAVSPTLRT